MKRAMPLLTIVVLLGGLLLPMVPLSGNPNPIVPDALAEEPGGMPGWPIPAKPIPHHEPGHLSRAESYTTQVLREDEMGVQQLVEVSGLDAMAADGLDPFAGNYALVDWDSIFLASSQSDQFNVATLTVDDAEDPAVVNTIPGSENYLGAYPYNDIAASDLNNDGQTEQIVAWLGSTNRLFISIGEMPGSLGRTTSAPAALTRGGAEADGWALDFDGIDDYVNAGTSIGLANSSFTVAFWAKRDAAGVGTDDFAVGHGASGTNLGLHLGFLGSNNRFRCSFHSNDLDTAEAYTDSDWHHWACTYDVDTNLRTIYRDGIQVAQDASAADYQGTGELDIGRYLEAFRSFDGLIDEVGIWNVARTPDRIQADMIRLDPDEESLLAYWLFDEGDGPVAADASDNLHNGTLVGPLWNEEDAPLAELHLLVRGYDEALWHCVYDVDSGQCLGWANSGGGTLLSAPAVASLAEGQFDAFVVGIDNDVYRRHWEGGWVGDWQLYADWPHSAAIWTGPTPELPPLAAVARDGGFDLFRVGPDNTLRWHDGTSWQPLGGMLASAPGAVSLAADHMQVFARGVDEALWTLSFDEGAWETVGDGYKWQRLELAGMDEGVTIASAPIAVSPVPGQIEVYVRGSDDQVWKLAFDGNDPLPWVPLGGPVASGVAIAGGNIFAQAEPGSLQTRNGGAWLDIGGLPPWHVVHDTGLTGTPKSHGTWQDFSLRLESGYFWGAGRSQIALAYFSSASRVSIAVFEIGEGFLPNDDAVLELELPEDIDYFSMTTGDFLDGDGTDEIALAYVRQNTYKLKIIDVTPEGLAVEPIEGTETVNIPDEDCDDYQYGYFTGTLDITGGDFDADGQDEISLITVWHNPDWIWMDYCDSWLYSMRMRVYDLLKNQATGVHSLHTYYVGGGEGKCKVSGAWWGEAIYDDPDPDRPAEIIGLAVAAGDTDGDGKDELLRTWPVRFDTYADSCDFQDEPVTLRFVRDLQVLKLPDNADKYTNTWDAAEDGIITDATTTTVDQRGWTYSYQDRLTVGDLNRDLKREIVWLMNDQLRTYRYVPGETPTYEAATANKALAAMKYPKLVTGGFTGEGLRVGRPNYRRQYSVGRIAAIINSPPKHVDVLNGVEYNINADDEETLAQLTLGEGSTTDVSLTTKRDWGLSATFETTIGSPEASHTTESLTTTYAENFSKETGYLTTFEIQETREASADDALFYIRTDYDVWEYPVLVDPTGTAADYISVVFPVSGPRLRVDRGNTCDSWYQPRHQLDNVWSYPSTAEQLVDRDEAGSGDLVTSSDYLVTEDNQWFTVNWGVENVTKQTSGFELGFANEFEWQIGGEELSFEIAGFGFSARLPSFKFSSKAEYNYAQLAEWEVTTTNDTEVYGYLNGLPPGSNKAGYDYAVWPYLYWAEGGYLMLDYTTSPEGSFWTNYDKPDPAFTLPWADGQCNTADEPDTELFTRDILVDPPVVSAGDPVTLTATIRNFSRQSNTKAFNVTFYLGDPNAGGSQIGDPQTIAAYTLGPRAVKTVAVHWTAAGSGDQRIYSVIDPSNQLVEVHDETDPYVNNNKGYGLVHMGALDIVDMGEATEVPYYAITYGLNPTMQASLFVPVGNLAENTRFDFRDADLTMPGIAGKAFELLVYRGELNWDTPEEDYSLQPDTDHAPAVMLLSYGDADIAGMDEASLTLYRLDTGGWQEATCPNYDVQRFSAENLLAVPVCHASVFALSDEMPVTESHIYLPLVLKNTP